MWIKTKNNPTNEPVMLELAETQQRWCPTVKNHNLRKNWNQIQTTKLNIDISKLKWSTLTIQILKVSTLNWNPRISDSKFIIYNVKFGRELKDMSNYLSGANLSHAFHYVPPPFSHQNKMEKDPREQWKRLQT